MRNKDYIQRKRETPYNCHILTSLKTAFANDDETGTFFKNMQEIQELLNNFVLHGKETQQEQP